MWKIGLLGLVGGWLLRFFLKATIVLLCLIYVNNLIRKETKFDMLKGMMALVKDMFGLMRKLYAYLTTKEAAPKRSPEARGSLRI